MPEKIITPDQSTFKDAGTDSVMEKPVSFADVEALARAFLLSQENFSKSTATNNTIHPKNLYSPAVQEVLNQSVGTEFYAVLRLPNHTPGQKTTLLSYPFFGRVFHDPHSSYAQIGGWLLPITLDQIQAIGEQNAETQAFLAAMCVSAPRLLDSLRAGVQAEHHHQTETAILRLDPHHATVYTAVFDAVANRSASTIQETLSLLGNSDATLQEAAHLHEVSNSQPLMAASSQSKVASGLSLHYIVPGQLSGAWALQHPTELNNHGLRKIKPLPEFGIDHHTTALVSAALGLSTQIVGSDGKEKAIRETFSQNVQDQPLLQIARRHT